MRPQKIYGFHSFQPPYKVFLCLSAVLNVRCSVVSSTAMLNGQLGKPNLLFPGGAAFLSEKSWV